MAIRARNVKNKSCPVISQPPAPPVQPPVESVPTKPKKPLKYFLALLK